LENENNEKRKLIPPEPDFDMVEISGQTQKSKQRWISVEEEYIGKKWIQNPSWQ